MDRCNLKYRFRRQISGARCVSHLLSNFQNTGMILVHPNKKKYKRKKQEQIIEGQMQSTGKDVICWFTDGSCRGNQGPCGAGACLCHPNEESVDLK